MIQKPQDVHVHKFEGKELVPINIIDNDLYVGNAGDRAFIMQTCKCGAKQAIDYGLTSKLTAFKVELEGKDG